MTPPEPWENLTVQVVMGFIPAPLRATIKPAVVAHAIVAGFLGLELLRDLRDDATGTGEVLDGLEQMGRLATAREGVVS